LAGLTTGGVTTGGLAATGLDTGGFDTPAAPAAGGATGTAGLPTPPIPPGTAPGTGTDISNVTGGDGSETGPQTTVGGTVVSAGTPVTVDPINNNIVPNNELPPIVDPGTVVNPDPGSLDLTL